MEKNREIRKSAVFPRFSLFVIILKNGVFPLNIAWKEESFNLHFDIFWEEEKTHSSVFLSEKMPVVNVS